MLFLVFLLPFATLVDVTQVDVRSNGLDDNAGKLFVPIVDKPHFESFSGIPIKQIRDNAITTLDLKGAAGAQLEACGGVVLAHSLKTNTSVTSVSQNICVRAFSGALHACVSGTLHACGVVQPHVDVRD